MSLFIARDFGNVRAANSMCALSTRRASRPPTRRAFRVNHGVALAHACATGSSTRSKTRPESA